MFENANELRETLFSVNELVGNYFKSKIFKKDSDDSYFWRFNENGIIISSFKSGCIVENLVSFEDLLSEGNDEYAVYLKLKKKFEAKSTSTTVPKTPSSDSENSEESAESDMKLTKKETISDMLKSGSKTISSGAASSAGVSKDEEDETRSEPEEPKASAVTSKPKKTKEVSASILELFNEEEATDSSETEEAAVNEESDFDEKTNENDKNETLADSETDEEPKKPASTRRKRTPSPKKRFTDILNFVCKTVKEFDEDMEISKNTRINELNLNDFDRVEFFCSIENHYDVAIDSDSIETIKDICDIIFSETE